LRAAIQDFWKA